VVRKIGTVLYLPASNGALGVAELARDICAELIADLQVRRGRVCH
jgi:hypothetical protein